VAAVRETFGVNVFDVLEATGGFAPLLGTKPGRMGTPGHIVAIGSISGRMALPFGCSCVRARGLLQDLLF